MRTRKEAKIGVIGVHGGWSSERLADTVEEKTGFRCLVNMDNVVTNLEKGSLAYNGLDLFSLDALIIKKAGPFYSPNLLDRLEVLRFLGAGNVKIYSDPGCILRVLDRLSCTVTLRIGGIPMPPTIITEDSSMALDAVNMFGKAVFKPLYSTKARGMIVAEIGSAVMEKIEAFKAAGNPVMYIQKFVSHPGKDMGLTFLGGRYIGAYARIGNNYSWNTTTTSGGEYQSIDPGGEIIALAHKAQSLFNLDFTCVDVVETPEGPMVFEVSAFGGFRGLMEANGFDAADAFVNYVLERLGYG